MKPNPNIVMPDADYKNATMLMGALLSVMTLYAGKPSLDLARLTLSLAEQLALPKYADSPYIKSLADKLLLQWTFVIRELEECDASIVRKCIGLN